jgi:hypothetical protein
MNHVRGVFDLFLVMVGLTTVLFAGALGAGDLLLGVLIAGGIVVTVLGALLAGRDLRLWARPR